MKRITTLFVLLLLFISFAFAGGAKEPAKMLELDRDLYGSEANIDWKQFEGETINILMVAHPWQEAIEPHIKEFEQLTGITVKPNVLAESLFWERVVMGLESARAPFDLTFLGAGYDTMTYYLNNWLEPLNSYINNPKLTDKDWYDINDINNVYRMNFLLPTLEGQYYGIPITSEVYMMWYRKDIFDQLGIKAENLKTMDDWLAATKRINDETDLYGASIRGGELGLKDSLTAMVFGFWGDEPYIFGRDMFFDENWNPQFTHPRVMKGFENWAKVMRYGAPGVTSHDWYDAVTAFQQGHTGIYWYDASLFSPDLENPEKSHIVGKIGYSAVPATEFGHKTSYWSWGLGIPANSQKKDPAWLFMQWATSKHLDIETGLKTWGATRDSSWTNPEYVETLPKEYTKAVNDSLKIIEPSLLYLPGSEEIMQGMLVALHDLYSGMPTLQAMQKLQNEALKVVRENKLLK